MKISLIFTLFLLFHALKTENYNSILALTWMAGHCEYLGSKCDRFKYDQWDHQSFTIHGFWPDEKTVNYYGDFNVDLFQGKLLEQMYLYWPPQAQTRGLPYFLWQHQWDKHGQDFSSLILTFNPEELAKLQIKKRNEELQIKYFSRVIELYKKLNVRKLSQGQFTKDEFAVQIKVPKESFYFVCSASGTFMEVRICYQITKSGFALTICSRTNSKCQGQIAVLKDWKKSEEATIEQVPQIQPVSVDPEKAPEAIPIEQKKENKQQKKNPSSSTKQQKSIEEERESNLEQQLENLDQKKEQTHIFDDKVAYQTVVTYILITALIVSAFWIALIIICSRIFRARNQEVSSSQLKEVESISTHVQSKQVS